MKGTALAKMEGLDAFYFMIWSKFRMSESLSDKELLEGFNKRFSHTLPLHLIDLVIIKSVEPKVEKVEADE